MRAYSIRKNEVVTVDAADFRTQFERESDPDELAMAVHLYEVYKARSATLTPAAQEAISEVPKRTTDEVISLHREYLDHLGMPWGGVTSGGAKSRLTHCWVCKKRLNSSLHLACALCGWMVCPDCGACGAGFDRGEVKGH